MSLKEQEKLEFHYRGFKLGLLSNYCTGVCCSVFLKDDGLPAPCCENIIALSRQAFLSVQRLNDRAGRDWRQPC